MTTNDGSQATEQISLHRSRSVPGALLESLHENPVIAALIPVQESLLPEEKDKLEQRAQVAA